MPDRDIHELSIPAFIVTAWEENGDIRTFRSTESATDDEIRAYLAHRLDDLAAQKAALDADGETLRAYMRARHDGEAA